MVEDIRDPTIKQLVLDRLSIDVQNAALRACL